MMEFRYQNVISDWQIEFIVNVTDPNPIGLDQSWVQHPDVLSFPSVFNHDNAEVRFHSINDGFYSKNDGFHTKVDGFHSINDGFHTKVDGFHTVPNRHQSTARRAVYCDWLL